jgi:hypothetical protein
MCEGEIPSRVPIGGKAYKKLKKLKMQIRKYNKITDESKLMKKN